MIYNSAPMTMDKLFSLGKCNLRDIISAGEVCSLLDGDDYMALGWLNAGIKLPSYQFEELYSNRSGSYCIYINKQFRAYYCVDMGD